MTSTLSFGIETVLIFCASCTLLGPLFYWLLTDGRPDPVSHSTGH